MSLFPPIFPTIFPGGRRTEPIVCTPVTEFVRIHSNSEILVHCFPNRFYMSKDSFMKELKYFIYSFAKSTNSNNEENDNKTIIKKSKKINIKIKK